MKTPIKKFKSISFVPASFLSASLLPVSILLSSLVGANSSAFADGLIPLPRSKPTPPVQKSDSAGASNSVGVVLTIKGQATAIGATAKRALKKAGPIFTGDVIKTGFSTHVQILFADQTKLAIGPRSKITVKDFVQSNEANQSTASVFAIKAARGTFRFITGNSGKAAYKISTKTATIGIRGTAFDFAYRGRTSVVLYKGSVEVCIGNSCAQLQNKCEMAVEQSGQMYKSHASQLPPAAFKLTFPYIRRENNLSKSYRLTSADCDSGEGSGPSINGGNGGAGGGGGFGGSGTSQ